MIQTLKIYLLLLFFPFFSFLKAQPEVESLARLVLALDDTLKIFQNDQLLLLSSLSDVKKNSGEIKIDLDKAAGAWLNNYQISTKGETFSIQSTKSKALNIPVTNGFDTIQLTMNFYNSEPTFSREYQENNKGSVQFHVPHVYELVYIAFALTDLGILANQELDFQSFYYEEMNNYFAPYREHPLIKSLNEALGATSFKEALQEYTQQSLPLVFEGSRIITNKIYPKPYRINPWWGSLLEELQDFADKTDYLSFYQKNKGYYEKLLHEQQQFLPIDSLWGWLENNFSEKNDSYRIIFSPLTKNAADHIRFASGSFSEHVLFLDNPEGVLLQSRSNSLKEAALLKKAFDEIMPFYQQPSLQKHHSLIQEVFSGLSSWLTSHSIESREEVFGVYMKNAAFCLWVEKNFPTEEARKIRQQIETEMLQKGYLRFYAFSRQLISLYEKYEGKRPLLSLYEEILLGAKQP